MTKKSDGDQVVKTQEDVAITQVENLAVDNEQKGDVTTLVETKEKDAHVEVISAEETNAEVITPTISAETITSTESTPSVVAPEERQATASVDFTGNWTLLVDDAFKSQYDSYLRKLGQPMLVRTVAMTVIGSTKEEAIQSEGGKQLFIRGMNVRGSWERTLEASETDAAVGWAVPCRGWGSPAPCKFELSCMEWNG